MKLLKFIQQLEGKPDSQRKALIIKASRQLGLRARIERYTFKGFSGENIVIDIGSGTKTIIVCAHSDAYPGSPGANDDASGVAVCLDVARKLKNQKLSHKVKIIIFDQEEDVYAGGGIGSQAYVERHGVSDIAGVINLELVGAGDAIVLWPVMPATRNSLLLRLIRLAISSLGLYHQEAGYFEDTEADFYSFLENGVTNSCAIATFHKKEAKILRSTITRPIWSYAKYVMGLMPLLTILKHYHNKDDSSVHLNEPILQKVSQLVYRTVTMLDKA